MEIKDIKIGSSYKTASNTSQCWPTAGETQLNLKSGIAVEIKPLGSGYPCPIVRMQFSKEGTWWVDVACILPIEFVKPSKQYKVNKTIAVNY